MTAENPVDILLMIHSLGHGGSERQVANTALGLDRSRFRPHVASALGGFQADELKRAGIPVLHLPLHSFVSPGALRVALLVRRYIRTHNIKLVHTFDYTLSLLGIPVARSCPGVIALSSQRYYMDLVPPKYKQMLLLTHRMAHGIVANCEEMKRHLTADYDYPADRIQVCYNGIDTARFSPQPRQADDLVIGTVGVLRPEKNLGLLLEAFARVQSLRPGMKLVIVGSGPERERLVARSVELGISSRCTFEPTTADVPAFMRAIDIFVHPSLSEGLPNAVMEAMACGCAVIASRVGGCAELIEHGRTGLLVPPGDLEALTACLASAIGDDTPRRKMAAAAADEMQNFSLARAAARMQSIYESYLRA
jgi:glycosyltransferase involved in cell wall biosynthesis